jgi:hypothetical protein
MHGPWSARSIIIDRRTAMTQREQSDWRRFVMEANAATAGFPPAPTETIVTPSPIGAHFPSPPSLDPIELLPPAAADKLRKLRLRREDAHRLVPEFETIRSASLARVNAQNELKRLRDPAGDGGFNLPETDPRVVAATKTLNKATAEFTRLQELQAVRSAAFQSASAAQANVEAWLRDGRPHGNVLEAIEVEPPTRLKGETVLDAVERFRRRGRELKADLHRIASAAYPSAYCKQRMREMVEALAQRGAPSVSRLVELDSPVEFQTQNQKSTVLAEQRLLAFAEVPDTLALVAWLHKDALIKRLDAEIDAEADDGAALSHEAREKAESEVMGDLLAVERDEAALTWSAIEQGLPVEFRPDISPLALLGVQLIVTPRAEPGPSTPGLSWQRR